MAKWTGSETETGKEQEKPKSIKGKDGVYYLTDQFGRPSDKIDQEYYAAQPGYESFMKNGGIKSFNSVNDVKAFDKYVADFEPSKDGGKGKGNDLKIKGSNSSGWKGKTEKIDPKSATFTGFDKIVSGKMLEDPGTKLSKKEKYNDLIEKIKGKHYDKDGNLVIPKFEVPDRIKLTKKQKKQNKKLDKKFNDKGKYKTEKIKAPTLSEFGIRNKYEKAGERLANKLGIDMDRPSNGPDILKDQAKRYTPSGALKIPDYSLDSEMGKKYLKIGKSKTNTSGINT